MHALVIQRVHTRDIYSNVKVPLCRDISYFQNAGIRMRFKSTDRTEERRARARSHDAVLIRRAGSVGHQ